MLGRVEPLGQPVQLVAEPLQVGDRLLEDVAEDVDVHELGAGRLVGVVGRLVGRPVVVGGEVLEVAAHLVGDGEPVEIGIVGEQPAVVGRDVQGGVADVDGPEQAPEILPDRPRVVGVAVLVGFVDGFGGQEPPVLAEGTEQDAVEELLRAGQDLVRPDGRVRPAEMLEGVLPHVGVADVELLGQLAADLFRGVQQLVEVALARGRHDPLGAEQEDEPLELALVLGKGVGVEPLVGVLVRPLVIEPGLPHRRDDDPVARQVDGVAVALIDGRHLAAQEGPVERVFRSLALDGHEESLMAGGELAEHGVGELAVHLDVFLAGEGVAVFVVNRPGVAEDSAEDVGQEVGKEFLLFERVGLGGPEQPGPAAEGFPHARYVAGQMEAGKARAENVGPEKRLGFYGHGAILARGPDAKEVLKPHFTQRRQCARPLTGDLERPEPPSANERAIPGKPQDDVNMLIIRGEGRLLQPQPAIRPGSLTRPAIPRRPHEDHRRSRSRARQSRSSRRARTWPSNPGHGSIPGGRRRRYRSRAEAGST